MGVATAVAIGGLVVSAYGASQQAGAAKDAAKAAGRAGDASVYEQGRQYDLSRQDMQPFREAGVNALSRQEAILNGDYSGFESSPDYLYNRGQMVQGMDRSAASRGRLFAGGYGIDMAANLNGLASQNLNSYWAKLAGQAGQGYNATSAMAGYGQNYANAVQNNAWNVADARSSSYQNQANAWSNFGNQAGQWGAWYAGQQKPAGG